MTKLIFIDTETTGLEEHHELWEIGCVVRRGNDPDVEYLWQLWPEHLELASPQALSIGRFNGRIQTGPGSGRGQAARHADNGEDAPISLVQEGPPNMRSIEASQVAHELYRLLDGAVLAGSNVGAFDMGVLRRFLSRWGYPALWHYHPIDVPDLVAGYLLHQADQGGDLWRPTPPWRSTELYRMIGVEAAEGERHSALGDARRDVQAYDVVTGRQRA